MLNHKFLHSEHDYSLHTLLSVHQCCVLHCTLMNDSFLHCTLYCFVQGLMYGQIFYWITEKYNCSLSCLPLNGGCIVYLCLAGYLMLLHLLGIGPQVFDAFVRIIPNFEIFLFDSLVFIFQSFWESVDPMNPVRLRTLQRQKSQQPNRLRLRY